MQFGTCGGKNLGHKLTLLLAFVSQTIAKVAGSVGPGPAPPDPSSYHHKVNPYLPFTSYNHTPPHTIVPDTQLPHQVPFMDLEFKGRRESVPGILLYDTSDIIRQTDESHSNLYHIFNNDQVEAPSHARNENSTPQEPSSVVKELENEENHLNVVNSDVNNIIYTKESELVNLSPFQSISINKRKKLEMYLKHLSNAQFNEVFKTILGYDIDSFNKDEVEKFKESLSPLHKSQSHLILPPAINLTSNASPSQDTRRCLNGCLTHKQFAGHGKGYASRVVVSIVYLSLIHY